MPSSLEAQRFKHAGASFNYNLKGDRKNNVVELATLKDWARFSAFGIENHKRIVESTFVLRLVGESNGAIYAEDDSSQNKQINYDSFVNTDFYASINMEDAHYLSQIYDQSASVEQVLAFIDDLVKEQRKYTSVSEVDSEDTENQDYRSQSRLGEQFMKLVGHVSTLDGAKLENLFSEVDGKGESYKKVFFDVVSIAGTNPAFMFMKKQIENGDLPAKRQAEFLSRVSYSLRVPSKALLDEYVNLCRADKIQSQPEAKRACVLPLASLIHQHCAKPHTKFVRKHQTSNLEGVCKLETGDEYYQKIMALVMPANADEATIGDKMLTIKVAGEIGVKASLEFLNGYAKQRNEHPTLRAASLWNMFKISHLYPDQVKKISSPLFFDRNELLEVRIAAFYNLWFAGIELHELEHITKEMQTEPNRQLVTYMYSLITSSAKSEVPCYKSWSKIAEHAVPIVKKAMKHHSYLTATDSMARLSSSWLKDYDYGTASLMSMIVSNESFAPTNIYYASTEFMSGLKIVPMTISVQAHGLDKLIKRVIGINGMLSDKETILDLFSLKKRQKRQAADKIKQEIQDVDKGIELKTRDFSDVYVALTLSVYGRVVTFMDIDSKQLKRMASEDGTIKIPNIRKIIQAFDNYTSQAMTLPVTALEILTNQMGLPVYQEMNAFDYKNFKLKNIKFDIEPGLFKDERAGKPVTMISGAIDAKLTKQKEIFVSTGVVMTNTKQKIGVGYVKKTIMNIPLKMSVDVDLADNKIIIKRQPIHNNLLYVKNYPVSHITSIDPEVRVDTKKALNLVEWRPYYNFNKSSQMKPFQFEFMTPLAIGIKVEGKHRADQDYSMSSWRRYLATTGLQVAKFMFSYAPTAYPLEMKVSTITTKENPTKEMTTVLSWKHYHEDDSTNDRNSIDVDLEKFTTKEGQPKPTTVAYKLMTTGGSEKERKLAIDLHYSRSADRLAHKWLVSYVRTPLDVLSPTSEATNLCWLGQMQYPKYSIEKFLALDLVDMEHAANLTSELTFGNECSATSNPKADPIVSLKATFDWSQEQKDMIVSAMATRSENNELEDTESVTKNHFSNLYNRCVANRKQLQTPMDGACLAYMYKAAELTNIQATFDYKNVPARWTSLLKKAGSLYTLARATYIDEVEESSGKQCEDTKGAQETRAYLSANMTSCSKDRRLTFKFDTPGYRVTFKSLPISFMPPSSYPLFDLSYYQRLNHRQGNTKFCSIGGNSVTTFDNMTMPLPDIEDDCYKVLSKDCSPEKNFMVLGAKKGKGKQLCVYVGQKFRIDFIPNAEGNKIADIKVNDASITVEQSKPYKKDTMFGQKPAEAFEISYNGAFYTLSSKAYKFSALTDGSWILVNQDKYYAGKSCGICGDANGEQTTELRSPTGCLYKNTDDFIWSYTIPSTCKSRPTKAC